MKLIFSVEYGKNEQQIDGLRDKSYSVVLDCDARHTELTDHYISFLRAMGFIIVSPEDLLGKLGRQEFRQDYSDVTCDKCHEESLNREHREIDFGEDQGEEDIYAEDDIVLTYNAEDHIGG